MYTLSQRTQYKHRAIRLYSGFIYDFYWLVRAASGNRKNENFPTDGEAIPNA